jgi:putative membrane protein
MKRSLAIIALSTVFLSTAAFAQSAEYDPMQVSAHKDATSLFERYAKGGDDPKLKDWAGKTLPALQHHLEMAQDMNKNRK